jgi:Xaa-Pro aminopeptidase
MLITPGPLLIDRAANGKVIWLKPAGKPWAAAIATILPESDPNHAAGNAVVMAHCEPIVRLLEQYRAAKNKAEIAECHAEHERLDAAIAQAYAVLTAECAPATQQESEERRK